MPDVPVSDLIVEGNELVIATHGRGFWVLDNIAPLRQATPEILSARTRTCSRRRPACARARE